MKRIFYTLLLVSSFVFGMTKVEAAKELMICEYKANVINSDSHIKYKITYYDDKSVKKYIAGSDGNYVESNKSMHSDVGIFNSNNKKISSIATLSDSFDSKTMESAYKSKKCPDIKFDINNYAIGPYNSDVEGNVGTLTISSGKTTIVDSQGNSTSVKEPTVTKKCTKRTTKWSIEDVSPATFNFLMYSNGTKKVEVIVEGKTQTLTVKNGQDLAANIGDYIIEINSTELGKIFKQNSMAEINNNIFTCPSELYMYEEDFSAGYYRLTTDKEEAEEWGHYAETKDGESSSNQGSKDQTIELRPLEKFCERKGILNAFKIVGYLIFVMKILVPLLLIILGTVDFAKAVISSDDKSNNEALSSLIRRVIIAVIIFIIPTVLDFLLTELPGLSDITEEMQGCTTCLLNPGECTGTGIDE